MYSSSSKVILVCSFMAFPRLMSVDPRVRQHAGLHTTGIGSQTAIALSFLLFHRCATFQLCITRPSLLSSPLSTFPLSLLKLPSPPCFLLLIAWFWGQLPFLREILPWIASLGGCLFGPAPCPIWPSNVGKAEWRPHNDQCLRAWLIFHVQTGSWLPGSD